VLNLQGRKTACKRDGGKGSEAVACRYSRTLVALLGTFAREVVLINGWLFGFFKVFKEQAIIRILLRAIAFW
jgi:hypothetical protein